MSAPIARRYSRPGLAAHFGELDRNPDARERRPQFVRHTGEEGLLGGHLPGDALGHLIEGRGQRADFTLRRQTAARGQIAPTEGPRRVGQPLDGLHEAPRQRIGHERHHGQASQHDHQLHRHGGRGPARPPSHRHRAVGEGHHDAQATPFVPVARGVVLAVEGPRAAPVRGASSGTQARARHRQGGHDVARLDPAIGPVDGQLDFQKFARAVDLPREQVRVVPQVGVVRRHVLHEVLVEVLPRAVRAQQRTDAEDGETDEEHE
jgi:hypothetical protein